VTEYRKLAAFNLLNRCSSDRVPFEWTINPYRGCEIGCKYCYARYTHEFMELRDPVDFETKIFAKAFNPAEFRTQIRKAKPSDLIAIGTATDPYQPAERRFSITRSILEVFAGFSGRRLEITTKSDLIVRDLELLKTIASANLLQVNITVTTMDARLARLIEPRAPRPDLRISTLRALSDAAIATGVFCAPLLPMITDREDQIEEVARAAAHAGARWLVGNPAFLTAMPLAVMLEFLKEHFPHLEPGYRERYGKGAYVRGPYAEQMKQRFGRLRLKYGLDKRDAVHIPDDPQLTLEF
jgi:DNA repair photolyase